MKLGAESGAVGAQGVEWIMRAFMQRKVLTVIEAAGQGTFVTFHRDTGVRTYTWTDGIMCSQAAECALGDT